MRLNTGNLSVVLSCQAGRFSSEHVPALKKNGPREMFPHLVEGGGRARSEDKPKQSQKTNL